MQILLRNRYGVSPGGPCRGGRRDWRRVKNELRNYNGPSYAFWVPRRV